MRVLLSTIGSRGDVQPLVALALQLKALGQDVHLCTPPDFREWIESLDVPVTPIGPELRTMTAARPTASAVPFSPERRRELAEASVAAQFETIAAAARDCSVIVAATALQIAARSVAEKMGIGYVFAAYCPAVLPSSHHAPPPLPPVPGQAALPPTADNGELWARDAARFTDLFGNALNSHRATLGLARVDDVRSHIFGDRPWLAADPTLGPWPDAGTAVFQPGAWILPDERPLPPEVERFLDAGDPPVYFGFGSARPPQDSSHVTMRIQAARGVGRRAIVSRGWADLSSIDEERDCLVVGEVNLHALLTRVAAAVHHGGAGTTTIAALAATPQVVIPQVYDQHYWAQRVSDLGIGAAHAPGTLTAASLTSVLERALRPDVAARAQSVATLVRTDGTQIAAEQLIAAAGQSAV
jgi:vancomycin aglycone glucosyltransferase